MTYHLDFSIITPATLALLGRGLWVSLEITFVAMLCGLALGVVLALMRLSHHRVPNLIASAYINVFRSIPLVMVLLWFFLLVPQVLQQVLGVGAAIDIRMASALVAFSLFEAAYYAEIIRAGIQGIGKGQLGAAQALGMRPLQAMRYVVLPQALRSMVPILLTQGIVLFQDTSLVYVMALSDFFGKAYDLGSRTGRVVEMLLFAGVVYFLICFGCSMLFRRMSTRSSM